MSALRINLPGQPVRFIDQGPANARRTSYGPIVHGSMAHEGIPTVTVGDIRPMSEATRAKHRAWSAAYRERQKALR